MTADMSDTKNAKKTQKFHLNEMRRKTQTELPARFKKPLGQNLTMLNFCHFVDIQNDRKWSKPEER